MKKSKKIEIRSLTKKDKKSWQKLWQSYLNFYGTSKEKIIYETTFMRLINKNNTDCDGFIALIDGKVVAMVHLIYHLHLWQEEKICYLQDLYVKKSYRKMGIATLLIQFVYSHADSKKMRKVYWNTQENNIPARKVYDKLAKFSGFVKYQRIV